MEELRRFLEWLLPRHAELGGVTELRAIGRGRCSGVWSCLIGPRDIDDVVHALEPLDDGPRSRIPKDDHPRSGEANIYFSLQPVRPSEGQQIGARLVRARRTTRDEDVLAYSLLVVDIDPEREPKGRSASDGEKDEARAVTKRVRAWFREQGVTPLVADSGNGFHLLVPLVPAYGDEVRQAAKDARTLLRLLHDRFSTPGAKVDTSTFNPSRILKLYGTVAVKGEPTPDHPHRVSQIDLSSIPEDVDLFERLQESMVATSATTPPARPVPRSDAPLDWKAWRRDALEHLPIEQVYGPWLTGRVKEGWFECRDPSSRSGDRNPSAGVADGTGRAERASFHSFRTGSTLSVFDFLVQQGRAVDFKSACGVVAELSGVALPGCRHVAVDRLAERWSGLQDQDERLKLLQEVVSELIDLPAFKREPLLARVQRITGLASRVFRATLAEVRRARRQDEARAAAPEGRVVVEYVTNQDTVEDLFAALVGAVKPANRFFRTERDVVFIRERIGPVLVTDRNLAGLLSTLIELRFMRKTEEGANFVRYGVLPGELARALATNTSAWSELPELKLYCRSPLFDTRWRFIGRPGFHEESGIYYDGPAVAPTDAGHPQLHKALADFHWKAEPDLVNFVGVLLTALTMPSWGRGHPFLAINGNKPGVGKTTLARVLGVLVEGSDPCTVSYTTDDAEFEKQLATRVEAGDRVIVIDNAKVHRGIESAVLERSITDTRLTFRRLGSNTSITRPQNDVLFCLTMNLTNLGTDLRRRALPVNLVLEEDVRKTTYGLTDVVGFVERSRLAIVAELAGMVQAWLDAERPECEAPAQHSTSQQWAATIDAILRLSGFDGFLTNFEESAHAFDPRFELMLDIATAHHARTASAAAGWVAALEDLLADRFKDRRGNPKSARSKSTIVGNLFREYLDVEFNLDERRVRLVRVYPEGEKRKPTYHFEEVAS